MSGGPGYRVRFDTVTVAGVDYRIRSLFDRQQYHDPEGEAERAGVSPASWPLFGQVWPSARVLARAMHGYDVAGKRILEIGAGLALASLVIHGRDGDITASDCHPLSAAFLQENLLLNHLPPMKYREGHWARVNPELGRFDLIIGSDVLYDRDQPQALSQFINLHTNPGAEVLIVDPDRGNRASFTRKMNVMGYSHTEMRIGMLPEGGAYKGRVLRYLKPEQTGIQTNPA